MLPPAEKNDIELLLNGIKIERIKSAKSLNEKESSNPETVAEEEVQEIDGNNVNMTVDTDIYNHMLLFLPDEERRKVIDKALSLKVSEGGRLHPVLVQYKQSVENYNKQ